jgi:exodeoxyribonuclease V alpha subunit
MILTGGPGTGKTTVLKGILCALRLKNYSIAVCAPTGRAAKRAKESTGYDAATIHRMLSFSWEVNGFKYNESNNLEEDVVVIDEFSMVDLLLFQSLLKAMNASKRLVIVGDVDQLPSVGAGNVLKDLIDSGVIPVVRLTTIHRQDKSSRIPYVAKDIKEGRMPVVANRGSKDFFFIDNKVEQSVTEEILSLVSERLPRAYHLKYSDIQVLCPQRSRALTCCNNLNRLLQERLNPTGDALQYGDVFYRVGDRVMQMKNNYDKGVFNGDIGRIKSVDEELGFMMVEYPEVNVLVKYEEDDLDELDLSYATTIHKSQGSEYDTVIIPILNTAYIMLQRNLVYTAITRARERCIIIGDRQALYAAVTNMYLQNRRLFVERQTYLRQRIQLKLF